MSLHSYRRARALEADEDNDFYGYVMAAMMRADDRNLSRLKTLFPEVWDELNLRYNAPQALLPGETNHETGDSYEELMAMRERAGLS